MCTYSLSHLSDGSLSRDLAARIGHERTATAEVLPYLAEFDARRLYLPAGYSSMFAYCVCEFGLSEDAAFKRIRVARTARQFPVIFTALAEGRLHMTAVVMLAPYLTTGNAAELLAAAERKRKSEIELLLAQRFPQPDLPAQVWAIAPYSPASTAQLAPEPVRSAVSLRVEPAGPPPRVAPLAPARFALQVTIDQSTHDDLRYAQALLGHQVPSGNVAEVLARALKLLVRHLEHRKFAATHRPRLGRPSSGTRGRHIPAEVRRAVWERDGGRCTFVSDAGRRCEERRGVEYDHVVPYARGGETTVGSIRLRCSAHNQYGAECTFGAEFMRHKREETRRAAEKRRAKADAAGGRAREVAEQERATPVHASTVATAPVSSP